jgi:hypothetical protein
MLDTGLYTLTEARCTVFRASSRRSKTFGAVLDDTTFEQHYTVGQLAKQWKYGRESIRKLVTNEPGVLKLQLGKKKTNCTYSVPESVARRIHTRLLNAA